MFGWQIKDPCRLVDTELGYASGTSLGRNKTKVRGHCVCLSVYVRAVFGKHVQQGKKVVYFFFGGGGGGRGDNRCAMLVCA